jgi:hypothetical protein
MFIIPTSGNNEFNMLVAFGFYWNSNLQIIQHEIKLIEKLILVFLLIFKIRNNNNKINLH